MAHSPDVAEVLTQARHAHQVIGDQRAGRSWFEEAYELAECHGDVEAMAAAVLGQAGRRVAELSGADGEVLLARLRWLEAKFDPRSPIGLLIRVRLAAEADYRIGGHDAILAMLEEATLAGDPPARALALGLAHHCLLGSDRAELRRRLAAELVEESVRTGERIDRLMGLLWQTVDLLFDGDDRADEAFHALKAELAEEDHLAVGYQTEVIEVTLAIRAGLLESAEAQAKAAFDLGTAIGDNDADALYAAHLIAIRWYQGRLGELQPMLATHVHSPNLRGVDNSPFAALSTAAALAGDRLTAAGALAALYGRDLAELPRSSSWLPSMYGVAETAYLLDDAELAGRVLDLVSPYADLPVVASLGVMCLGSARHLLGVAALTTGELDLAVTHLDAAVKANEALRHRPAAMLSRARLAQALSRRDATGDAELARAALAAAHEDAEALGVSPPGFRDEPRAATCTRTGQRWLVEYGRRSALVAHSVGISYVAVLLANPGRDVPAVDLAAGPGTRRRPGAAEQPVLDRTAVQQYRQRVEELQARIDSGRGGADAVAERDWLLAELGSAAGLAGRIRTFTDDGERARLAVGKAIRRAVGAVEQADPVIGAHLRASLHTGAQCSYRPA